MKTHRYWVGLVVLAACGHTPASRSAMTPLDRKSETMTTNQDQPHLPQSGESKPSTVGANSAPRALPTPKATIVDRSLPAPSVASMTLAARRYFGFWDSGDPALAHAALSPEFVDHTLPPGRPQGPSGPLFASEQFRRAVPDLRCEVEELMLVGERAVARLHFTGHFTGTFGSDARQGDGRGVDFIATDIYGIQDGRIVEDWHLEDNLTLLQQLGVVPT